MNANKTACNNKNKKNKKKIPTFIFKYKQDVHVLGTIFLWWKDF